MKIRRRNKKGKTLLKPTHVSLNTDSQREQQRKRAKVFAKEYVRCYNATKAAILAGYSVKAAPVRGHVLLRKAYVRKFIENEERAAAKRINVSIDKVKRDIELAKELSIRDGQYSAALKAAELQGKQLGMFVDQKQVKIGFDKDTLDEIKQVRVALIEKFKRYDPRERKEEDEN